MTFEQAIKEMENGKILTNDLYGHILHFKYKGKFYYVLSNDIKLTIDFGNDEKDADWEVIRNI